MSYKVLVVDDDTHIREVLRFALEKEGYQVQEAADGADGLNKAQAENPDVIILDILMPEMNGLEVCHALRKTSETPIVFLSSKDSELDRIMGLEIGGDDYLTKPFSPRELVARLKIIFKRLRLSSGNAPQSTTGNIGHGNIQLNATKCKATWHEKTIPLTATEFNLLEIFLRRPEKVYTRDELVQADVFKDIISDRTIDSHIRRLRRKFSEQGCETAIETVHGFGYKLGSCQ